MMTVEQDTAASMRCYYAEEDSRHDEVLIIEEREEWETRGC